MHEVNTPEYTRFAKYIMYYDRSGGIFYKYNQIGSDSSNCMTTYVDPWFIGQVGTPTATGATGHGWAVAPGPSIHHPYRQIKHLDSLLEI